MSGNVFANNSAAQYGGALFSGNSYTPTAEANSDNLDIYSNGAITDY